MSSSKRKSTNADAAADASKTESVVRSRPPIQIPLARPSTQPAKADTMMNVDAKVSTHPQSGVGNATVSTTMGRYTILGELGRGGMGAVYLAEDSILKRKVALKIPQFEPQKSEQMQARFLREAQLAAQLSHPNICQVHDVGVIDGQYVMAMEYIEGKTLAAFTKPDNLLSERQAASLVRKVAMAVEAAHQQGMIHRDLKPGNIMLPKPTPTRKTIEPKVMDFGLAKSMEAQTTELTKSGMIVGTPCYMSKEQWSGKETQLGPQCDVYSLGIILYELLTGCLPYDVEDGEPATAWFVKLVTEPQLRPSERLSSIDAGLDAIVMKAITREPGDRFASMAEFASALEDWLRGKPVTGQTQLGIRLGAMPSQPSRSSVSTNAGGGWRGIIQRPPVLWGGLGGFGALLLFGVFLVIRMPNGEKVPIELPDGATFSFETTNGLTTGPAVTTDASPKNKAAPPEKSNENLPYDSPIAVDSSPTGSEDPVNPENEPKEDVAVDISSNVDSNQENRTDDTNPPQNLSHLLTQGYVLPGEFRRKGSDEVVGDFTLTILQRNGDVVEGWYFKQDRNDADPGRNVRFSGSVTENHLHIESDNSFASFEADGDLIGDVLTLDFRLTEREGEYEMTAIIVQRERAAIASSRSAVLMLPMASVYTGTWVGTGIDGTHKSSDVIIHVTRREGETFEAELNLPDIDRNWVFHGIVNSDGVLTGELVALVDGGSHELIGNNKILGTVSPDSASLAGKFYWTGTSSQAEFTATRQHDEKSETAGVNRKSEPISDASEDPQGQRAKSFPVDAIYKGVWTNADSVVCAVTVTVTARDAERFEAEWVLHKPDGGTWIVVGSITKKVDAIETLNGVFTDLVGGDHPNENTNKVSAEFSRDGTRLRGTIFYDSGRSSTFDVNMANTAEPATTEDMAHSEDTTEAAFGTNVDQDEPAQLTPEKTQEQKGKRKTSDASKAFAEGDVYEGTWTNHAAGATVSDGFSQITVTVLNRSGDVVETEWEMHTWGHSWRFNGTLSIETDGTSVFTSTDVNQLEGDHPNEGNTVVKIKFDTSGRTLKGTAFYNSGRRSEFEAKLVNTEK